MNNCICNVLVFTILLLNLSCAIVFFLMFAIIILAIIVYGIIIYSIILYDIVV